jgi:HSP20 family protein
MSAIPWKNKQAESGSSPLNELRNEVERLFDTYLREPLTTWGEELRGEAWAPLVDVSEADREFVVEADLPGVAPDDLQLSVTGNTLVIEGERKPPHAESPSSVVRRERRFGAFRRAVELPALVEADSVSAEIRGGVLTVRLNKSPAAATRRIDIRSS